MLKAFLVDDEELSLLELKYILGNFPNLNICGTASSGKEAIEKIITLKPDVVFLDIQLNDLDGIQIAEHIKQLYKQEIKIIFITAYEEYAIKAFELNAIDYILKPFAEDRISETISRVIASTEHNNLRNPSSISKLQKIAVEVNGKLKLIDINQIVFVEAQGRSSLLYVADQIYTCNYSLKTLEDKLNNNVFFKPHRSYLINLEKISEIIPWFNSTYQLIMNYYPEKKIPVTRPNTKILKEIVGL